MNSPAPSRVPSRAPSQPALLPAGFQDLLPPEAEAEAICVGRLMKTFASHGYERVKPPMLEFADTLLDGAGSAVAEQTFRIMDPASDRMLGLRADMTPQVARLAASRLHGRPRPLRLSYAGQCLRMRGSQTDPNRQVAQAGIELIGPDSPEADAEMVLLATEALQAVHATRFSVDITLPGFTPAVLDEAGLEGPGRAALCRALDRKDAAGVAAHGGPIAGLLTDLLLAAGPVAPALAVLEAATLGPAPAVLRDRLRAALTLIHVQAPGLRLTLDPLESRHFRYHTGLCMTLYATGRMEELGRGGRYLAGADEPATGFTLFPDAILRVCPPPPGRARVFLPHGSPPAQGARLRAEGLVTIPGLTPGSDPGAEARRLRCTHVLVDGVPVPL